MTPREILLNRHRQTEPRLNRIRREVIQGIRRDQAVGSRIVWSLPGFLRWRHVALATAWLMVLLLQVGIPEPISPVLASGSGISAQEMAHNVRENRRQLHETLETAPEDEHSAPTPEPRSSLKQTVFNT